MQQDFDGRVVLITGGASGIGAATARQLILRGASVALADIDVDGAEATAQQLRDEGGLAQAFQVDAGDEVSVETLISSVVSAVGDLHCAVNSAGISDQPVNMVDMSLERWDRMVRINQTSIFLCMKHQLRHFLSLDPVQRGTCSIVNIASGAGLTPAPGQVHYTAAKHAVLGITKYAAQEQVNNNIRVNAVCPGFTDTPMVAKSVPQQMIDMLPKILPHGRMGTADEIAAVIVWLCSQEASWVNGQSLVVDGGQLFH